jgi:sulfotransferase family protein
VYPDFIGIGAQKAGTTWLHRNLRAHPEIWMPKKEVHYFNRKIHDHRTGIGRFFGRSSADAQWRRQFKHSLKVHLSEFSPENLFRDIRYYALPYTDRWYASVFEPKKGRTTGEITPAYSVLDEGMISHVHGLMPRTKIIFMMRTPIERAWSQAVMSFDKAEQGSARYVADERFLQKFERNGLTLLTDYRRTLENWRTFYPEEQIFVGFLEDVRFYPESLLRRLYEFLGVDPSFEPPAAREKIHSRSEDKMPTRLAVHLARTYHDELEQLHERFGGYASFWLYCARRLIEGTVPEESIPYPLWESPLWEEWTNGAGGSPAVDLLETRCQSGPLSSVQAVR